MPSSMPAGYKNQHSTGEEQQHCSCPCGQLSPTAWSVPMHRSSYAHPCAGGDSYGSQELADWFDSQNKTPEWAALEQWLGTEGRAAADIISFSHFLPHQVRCRARCAF